MKLSVTSELSTLIKTMRMQRRIASKSLAAYIGKSPSYISKLENGEVRYIQEDELTKILDYIIEGEDFFADKIPAVIKTLSSYLDLDKMSQQIWLLDYDIIKRPITLTEDIIDDINLRLNNIGCTVAQFAGWLNANKDSSMSDAFPANELIDYNLREIRLVLIRVIVDENELSSLLNKKNMTTNYSLIYSIIFCLFRIEEYGEAHLKIDDGANILEKTRIYLNNNGVYSFTGFAQPQVHKASYLRNPQVMLSAAEHLDYPSALVSSMSAVNAENIDDIIKSFLLAFEHDALYGAQVFETFKKNLVWDSAFMLKLMGQSFHELNQISFHLKKQLLDDITDVLDRYMRIPEHQKKIETYP